MQNKKLIVSIFIIIVAVFAGCFVLRNTNQKEDSSIIVVKDPLDTVPGEGAEFETNEYILGNREDLISFSIYPNTSLPKQIISYRGTIKGGYFFEANILVGITDKNKNMLLQSNAVATTDWMTADPVGFEGYLDFSTIPSGEAYIEIHNDNASGLPENDKAIYIPIIIQ